MDPEPFFIAPAHRGSGLADLLLDHVARAARAAGALDLRLYAYAPNERAIRAYTRCGFKRSPYLIMTQKL